MIDYTITWAQIVERMREKFGFAPDSTEPLSMGEIEAYIEKIWDEHFEMLYEKEKGATAPESQ